jgi:MFS family permease
MLTAGLVLTITMVASESMAVSTVLPLTEAELGRLDLYGWLFSAFFLGNLVGIVTAGRAADTVRPAVPFAIGLGVFVVGLVVAASASSMEALVAGRAVQGLGAGALPATAYVVIGRAYPSLARPRMFALLSTAWVVPALLGPALAGWVGEGLGWRWVFGGLVPLVVVVGALALIPLARLPAEGRPFEGRRVVLVIVAAIGAVATLSGVDGLAEGRAWWPLVVGLALLVPGLARLSPPGALRIAPGLAATVVTRGLLTFAFFSAASFLPLALTNLRGLPTGLAGAAISAGSLAWTVGSWTQERLVRRRRPGRITQGGLLVVAVGAALTAAVTVGEVPTAVTYLGWAVAGIGMGTAYSPLSFSALQLADPGEEGAATSALQLWDQLGVALGTGLAGALIAWGAAQERSLDSVLRWVFLGAAVVALAGAVAAGRIGAEPAESTELAGATT